jgi:hypothetical protein
MNDCDQIRSDGIQHLVGISVLSASGAAFNDSVFPHLGDNITTLNISIQGSFTLDNVNGSGFHHLPSSLRVLDISYCRNIVNSAWPHLSHLHTLVAIGSNIDDVGISHLSNIHTLILFDALT